MGNILPSTGNMSIQLDIFCCCSAKLTFPKGSWKMSPYGKQGDMSDEKTMVLGIGQKMKPRITYRHFCISNLS
jgi:hypothetical protein